MRSSFLSSSKLALWVGLTVAAAVAAPAACFYPSYTFNEPEGSGGAGGASSSSQSPASSSTNGASTSTASAASTGTSSSVSGSSVSTSGSGVVLNDCNGVADCANPMCTAYACVTTVPAGWTGYYALYDGPAGMDPGCKKLFPTDAYTGNGGLNAPAATCSACTCGAPVGQTCTLANITTAPVFVSNLTCAQQAMQTACGIPVGAVADGSCVNQSPLGAGVKTCGNPMGMSCPGGALACNVGVKVGSATASGGSCAASPEVPNIPKLTWMSLGHACGQMTPGTGCNVGQACLPKAGSPYQDGICISKVGESACPPAFPNQHIYYEDKTDTRACSSCTCGGVVAASCSTTMNLYSDGACNTLLTAIPAGGCADLVGNPGISGRKAVNTTFSGSCAPDPAGGQPTGSAAGVKATTFCCK